MAGAQPLAHCGEAPGVAASILEGLDEILTVKRLKLPAKLRRSLACTNSIENMMGTVSVEDQSQQAPVLK
jgi:hypothetical protein